MSALRLIVMALLLLIPAAAHAHLTPNSMIELDFRDNEVLARLTIPTNELAYATGAPAVPPERLATLLRLRAPSGAPWRTALVLHAIDRAQPQPDLVATIRLTPPRDAPARVFTLHYATVIDRVPSHIVLVFARSDFAGGVLQSEPELIGALRAGRFDLAVNRGPGSGWRGFAAAIGLGAHHIAEGHDHLLFLLALLLPAPLVAAGRRWGGYAGLKPMVRTLIAIVTAFTIGHSLTLIGGALLGWRLPEQPVEIAIAVSILISAIHAWRPLFAGLFGLVHGLAFATIIGDFALDPLAKASAILGFNLGIEVVQLLVIAAALPLLIVLGCSPRYPAIRTAGAAFAGIAAAAWAVERITATSNGVAETIDTMLGYAGWPLAAASIVALILLVRRPALRTASAPA